MLRRSLQARVRGAASTALQQHAANEIDRLVEQMFEAAVALWEQNEFAAFDDMEENLTVQLYRWCREAIRADTQLTFLVIQLEWSNLTPGMLAATEDVRKGVKRPDLRLEIGAVGRSVECKRLGPGGTWCQAYVDAGISRFVTGNYGHADTSGYMVGYMQGGSHPQLVALVNAAIDGHADMGVSHRLAPRHVDGRTCWNDSLHHRPAPPPFVLHHLHVDTQ